MSNRRAPFFVFVVESPSADDLYHRRHEAEMLQRAVALNDISLETRLAVDHAAFATAMSGGLQQEIMDHPGLLPVVHISAHGSSRGIQLTSGHVVEWGELRNYLRPVNSGLNGQLLVCMSSCEGCSGFQMAMFLEDHDFPFAGIVGSTGCPTWSDTSIAYATFYHRLAKGASIHDAVEAMRMASGNSTFQFFRASDVRTGYKEFLQDEARKEVLERLSRILADSKPHDEVSSKRNSPSRGPTSNTLSTTSS